MGILSNFTPTVNSDNRFVFIDEDNNDEIIIGASCTHVFKLSFNYSSYAKSGKIIYKQGFDVLLDIDITPSMICEAPNRSLSIITLNLTPLQTQKFKETLLDTFCQIKLITKEDKVMYDEPHPIKVIMPLRKDVVVGGNE